MSFDLSLDDAQQAIADTLAHFCREQVATSGARAPDAGSLRPVWKQLAELGVLGLGSEDGDGGACELVAALEALGAEAFPGPLAASVFAAQLLSGEERARLLRGDALVSLGTPQLFPFADEADLFFAWDGRALQRVTPGRVEGVETVGGEAWGRAEVRDAAPIEAGARAWALHDIALAAQLAGTGHALVSITAEHVRHRVQFGRPLGEFQAVAHPLADVKIGVDAATGLARIAAFAWDESASEAPARAAAAVLSARRAALEAAHTCHQLFGALGITTEGGVFRFSRRARQLASQPPGPERARATLLAAHAL